MAVMALGPVTVLVGVGPSAGAANPSPPAVASATAARTDGHKGSQTTTPGPAPTVYALTLGTVMDPIDAGTDSVGTPITVGSDSDALAITPNGQTAYVVSPDNNSVTPVDLATGTAGTPITVPVPTSIAITPNGQTAYVTSGQNSVVPITLATGTAGTAIPAGTNPVGIAITPNGATAYVTDNGNSTVTPITLATGTAGTPITVGPNPTGIAITPDGTMAYVTDKGHGEVTPITLATGTAGTPITVGAQPKAIAITPNGATAYVTNTSSAFVSAIALATGTASRITVGDIGQSSVVVSPDGTTAFVNSDDGVLPINTATNTPDALIHTGGASGIAVTPDPAPVAAFTVTPAPVGGATLFNASASSSPGAPITSYTWSFGDGGKATSSGPTVSHVYTAAGAYTVSLKVTDADGTSIVEVFTGQTVSLDGGPSATTSELVKVGGTCDHWTASAGGNWKDAADWSAGVPTSTTAVCISVVGSYTVSVTDGESAGSLYLGSSNGTPTVAVTGQYGSNPAELDVTGNISNAGSMSLTSSGTGSSEWADLAWGGILTNTGAISSSGLTGATGYLDGNLDNHGTLSVGATTAYNNDATELDNAGRLVVAPGGVLTLSGGGTQLVNDTGGSIANSGQLNVDGSLFTQGAGYETGTAVNLYGDSTLQDLGSGAGSFSFTDDGTFTGNVAPGQSLSVIPVAGNASATVSVPQSFTNAGIITVSDSGTAGQNAVASALTWNGTLTNTGSIALTAGPVDGSRDLEGNLVNQGSLTVTTSGGILEPDDPAGGTLTNNGQVSVGTTGSFTVYNGDVINAAGSIVDDGAFVMSNSTFEEGTGTTVDLPVELTNSSNLAFEGPGSSAFTFTGSGQLSGNLAAGQSVSVLPVTGGDSASVTASQSFTNAGTIVVGSSGSADQSAVTATLSWVGTLTNAGSLSLIPGPVDASRQLEGNLVNQGTLTIDTLQASLEPADPDGGQLVNEGSLLDYGSLVVTNGDVTNAAGELADPGSLQLDASVFEEGAGTVVGTPVDLSNGCSLALEGSGPSAFTFTGNGLMTGSVATGQTVNITSTNGGSAEVSAPQSFTNAGTIVVTATGPGTSPAAQFSWDGTLTNAGTLSLTAGSVDGVRRLMGDLINQGTLNVATTQGEYQPSDPAGGTFTNLGSIDIGTLDSFTVTNGDLVNSGGNIDDTGSLALGSSVFEEGAGTISGSPVTLEDDSSLALAGSGASQFAFIQSGQLSGNIAADQSVTVAGITASTSTTVTAPASFTNAGTLLLTSQGALSGSAQTAELQWNGVLTNAGTLEALNGSSGGDRVLDGPALVNTGSLTVQVPVLEDDVANAAWTNAGTISVASGDVLSLTQEGPFTQTATGTFSPAVAAEAAGSISATGLVSLAGNLTVTGTPVASFPYEVLSDARGGAIGGIFTTVTPTGFTANYTATSVSVTDS
jgi:DNA-binding beta-propeller fold protein YncE